MVWKIPLESSQQKLQLYFRPHFNRRSAHKVIGPQNCGGPTLRISKLPLGSPGTKWHLGVGPMARHKVYYKGEGDGFPPIPVHGESCESMHQKCSKYALTICCLVCVSPCDWLSCLLIILVPSWSSNTPLYPRNVTSQGVHVTRSQVTRWNPLEGSTKSSCRKLKLGGTLPASNSRKG